MSLNTLVYEAIRQSLNDPLNQSTSDPLDTVSQLVDVVVRPDVAHVDDRAPYVIYQRVGLAPSATLSGAASSLTHALYQIDVYASTRSSVDAIAAAIRSGCLRVQSMSMTLNDSHCSFEADASVYRETLTYSVWAPTPI
ncbi:MAG: DUF3168 domain-containing protein [Betaproteobacteria bacterium]|nr:DUF3168 domain-containing protein [Betaproteobacteria bacterium]